MIVHRCRLAIPAFLILLLFAIPALADIGASVGSGGAAAAVGGGSAVGGAAGTAGLGTSGLGTPGLGTTGLGGAAVDAAAPAAPVAPAAGVDAGAPAVEMGSAPAGPTAVEAGAPSRAETFFNAEAPAAGEAGDISRRMVQPVRAPLKQFGYDFFRRGFRPDQQALVGPDYVLGPGDSLRIDVWGNIEGNYAVTVDRNGEITLPKVGVINLWGQTFAQARETIRRQIQKYFTNFEMNVTMGGLRSIQIFMVGEVNAPGTYQVSSLSTIVTALSEASGPAKSGSLRQIELLRDGRTVAVIDLYDFFLRGDKSADMRLQSGDTLFVPVAGPLVGVTGNVRRPAIYELKGGETLQQALDLAGGLVPTAYLQKVQVDRVDAHQAKTVIDLNLATGDAAETALKVPLQDRDMVRVAPIAMSGGFVRLEGYAVRPGDYQLSPGMRLADLILPYDNLLPEFFPGAAQVIRLNPPEFRPEILTIDLQKALEGDPRHNLLLQEYDTVKLFSRRQMEELPHVVVSGAVLNPGTFRLYDNMTVRDLVAAAGNLRRSAYVAEAEITRFVPAGRETKTERRLIDLAKALQGDPQHNVALQVDDHLFVRSIPDYAERLTVEVRGEVLFPGTYAIGKGEKLASVIERAGGYAERAYLRGAVFTRESLKETQRRQTNRLIAEQEQEILRLSAEMASGSMDAEALAASQKALTAHQQLLQKLRQVPVTGRMVVQVQPLEELATSPDNIELMNGDTLFIPENPKTVTVLGEVYTPTSLAHRPGKTVSYYLDKVGGAREEANEDEMFIVRADGTVLSRQQGGLGIRWDRENFRWITGGFNTTELLPGDTLLVPQEIEEKNYMRDIKDITQILYQMGLGAAAISVL